MTVLPLLYSSSDLNAANIKNYINLNSMLLFFYKVNPNPLKCVKFDIFYLYTNRRKILNSAITKILIPFRNF